MARKLLLADDSITIQKVVELVLAEEDFEIKAVSNGEDALKIVGAFNPDIVLADIEMPKMNGYQLCDKIKKNPATSNIPVILLAGAFEPIDEELAKEIKADDSVIKPFESQELISKINSVLTMGAATEEAVFAEEAASDSGEEVFEIAEEAVEAEEAVVAEAEEDLWAMEAVSEVAETAGADFAQAEELDESFAVSEETAYAEPAEAGISFAEAEEAPAPRPATQAARQEIAVLSKEEMKAIFEKTVQSSVAAFLSSLDIKSTIVSTLTPAMKDSVEKVLWEIAPDLAEKMLKEILKGSIASLTAEVEKVIWETVPDLASSLISKEIEKIRSDF